MTDKCLRQKALLQRSNIVNSKSEYMNVCLHIQQQTQSKFEYITFLKHPPSYSIPTKVEKGWDKAILKKYYYSIEIGPEWYWR